MPTALAIHRGLSVSERLRERIPEATDGFSVRVKTARFGPEATYEEPVPSRVVTDDKATADFWENQGADVVRVTDDPLPDWLPKRAAFQAAESVSTVEDVQALARGSVLTTVPGIGEAYAEKIEAALIEHTDYDASSD